MADTVVEVNPAQAGQYFNRELSWLEFNRRVLCMAQDPSVPLLERLRFLTICTSNLDEFFEIRVAGLKHHLAFGIGLGGADGLSPAEVFGRVHVMARALVHEQYRVLNDELIPALEASGIRVLKRAVWTDKLCAWVQRYFQREVLPVLTPVGLDPAHPFPRILNKSLNFIVALKGKDAFGRASRVAVVQAPRLLPRLIPLPEKHAEGPHDFVLLSSMIHAHVDELFPGLKVRGCYQFRVTRDSDLWVDEEEVDDLLKALKGELLSRRFGGAARLEVVDNCPDDIQQFLLEQFNLSETDLYRVDGPVNLYRLSALYDLVDRPDLKYRPFIPGQPGQLRKKRGIFEVMRKGDILLHHPYQSFAPVVEFLHEAARDPRVLAIKQTVYRAGSDSPLAAALIEAARSGKEVTAVIELRARFDEAANIDLATRLQEAGAKVVYGVVGYKTHAKLLLVVRRDPDGLRRYVHLGTGNYHTGTTRAYTDFGLLTCHEAIGEDVHNVFQQLTGFGRVAQLHHLVQSPFTLLERMLQLVDEEAQQARKGKRAHIVLKCNALIDATAIQALYAASQAGVKIDLIMRGICCLRPGVPGLSENIRVRSVVGRFLEHTRVFYFHHGGDELVYCASADWMPRNFYRRIEVCFPVLDRKLARRVIEEGLLPYLEDDAEAWELLADGSYQRVAHRAQPPVSAQRELLEMLSEDAGSAKDQIVAPGTDQ